MYLPSPWHLHCGRVPGYAWGSAEPWQTAEKMASQQCLQTMLPGWFTLYSTRASSPCLHHGVDVQTPPGLYHTLLQVRHLQSVGPTYSHKLVANLFPAPFPGNIVFLLAWLGKISVGLGSQILEMAAGEAEVLLCSWGELFIPSESERALPSAPPLWRGLQGRVSHQGPQPALQMLLQPRDLGGGMPASPAPSCSALSEMGPFWPLAEMWALAPGNCGQRGKQLWCLCVCGLLQQLCALIWFLSAAFTTQILLESPRVNPGSGSAPLEVH